MASSALVLIFVPVQTNLPFRKSKNVAEGDFNLKDNPGNLCQLHFEPTSFELAICRSTLSLNEPIITTFSTVISKSNKIINNNTKHGHIKNKNALIAISNYKQPATSEKHNPTISTVLQ